MDKFQNKYRIPSSRLQNGDYGSPGFYFITVCTKNRKHYFGEIINDEMHANILESFVNVEWIKTPGIRPDMNLELGEFVVMPNHFHGIMMIGEHESNRRDAMHCVSTKAKNKFGPQSKNLGSIMRGFKSSITTNAKKLNLEFDWQERFHDHIIRNHEEFIRVSKYISSNPGNWKEDRFFDE